MPDILGGWERERERKKKLVVAATEAIEGS